MGWCNNFQQNKGMILQWKWNKLGGDDTPFHTIGLVVVKNDLESESRMAETRVSLVGDRGFKDALQE